VEQRGAVAGEKGRLQGLPVTGAVRGRSWREQSPEAVHSGQEERRESVQADEGKDRPSEVPGLIGEAEADTRAVFCGHKV
jgi:hypothetical protein